MQNIITGSKIRELTVENALMTLVTYKIIDSCDRYVRTERSKRAREIFGFFGIKDPEEIPHPKLREIMQLKFGNLGLIYRLTRTYEIRYADVCRFHITRRARPSASLFPVR